MGEKKLVPKRRFKAFELDWEEKSFESLAEIVRGASPRPIEDPKWFDSNSNTGWLRISDVTSQNGRIINLEQKISVLGQQKTRVLTNSHLLLSIAATVGKPVINYVKTGVHDGFLIFLKPKFDIEYMYQWLEMFRSKWQQYGQPGSQVNLNSDIVKKHILLIPGIEEQQKIGQFFKVLDERIANQERKIAKVKDLKSAYLTEMFPQEGETIPKRRFKGFEGKWKSKLVDEIMDVTSVKRIHQSDWEKEGIRFLRARDLVSFYKNETVEDPIYISKEKYSQYIKASGKVNIGDLLVTGVGTIGVPMLITNTEPIYFKDGNIIWFKNNNKLDGYYLYYYFTTENLQNYIKNIAGIGTVGTYTIDGGKQTPICFPEKEEQQKLGAFFKNLDNQIETEEKKLDKLQKMKEAYLEEMFV